MPSPVNTKLPVGSSEDFTEPRPEEFEKFKKVLYEIFQFDVADLDFGIYRILNEKRDAVDHFIEEDLHEAVKQGITTYVEGQTEELRQEAEEKRRELEQTGQQLGQNVFTEDGDIASAFRDSPLAEEYVELNEKLQAAEMADTTERRVYDDLAKFFRRYYDEGDFITQRRFQAGDSKYVVPYNGEEVMLHWANRDQYYVKTSEHFKNYRFDAQDYDVEFKLMDAESPKDNVKEKDTRYFVLHGDDPVSADTEAKTCTITMAYRAITEDEKDTIVERYNEEAGESRKRLDRRMLCTALEAQILDDIKDATLRALLTQPRKESENYSRLFAHLNRYTAANTADYFVHKDLEGFLSGQLEYFIQNEVLDLGDVLAGESPSVAQQAVNRAKVVKSVGERVITFLAQIENFQKRLFEKKKFVVDTGYCVTLDRVPEELYNDILENDKQLDEWRELYAVDQWDNGLFSQGYEDGDFTRDFLEVHPHVMIDTCHFDQAFVDTLLDHLSILDDDGIEAIVDGLCIQGENFQTLNLLKNRFRNEVKCTYIDPPYNSPSSEILYKNNFKHSSWISMMANRVSEGRSLLSDTGVHVTAIDENEQERLGLLLRSLFPGWEQTCVTVVHNPSGQQGDNFSYSHDYAFFSYPGDGKYIGEEVRENDDEIDVRYFRDVTGASSLREAGENCFYPIFIQDGEVVGFGDVCSEDYHPPGPNVEREDGVIEVYPVDPQGVERKWRFARQTVESVRDELSTVYISRREDWDIKRTKDTFNYKTVWAKSRHSANNHGTQLLNNIVPGNPFTYPKSLYTVADAVDAALNSESSGWVLDFFAGSGTTGHAVTHLNRRDVERVGKQGTRRYIMVEMDDHHDTVLLPRMKKIAFANSWNDGIPQNHEGYSHVIQYHRLESYEDALNNIEIDEPNAIQQKIFDAWGNYEMRYMLDEETDGSETLLKPEAFQNPFVYTLRIQHGMESPKQHAVDLEATFNYLIGLKVKTRRVHHNPYLEDRRYVVVTGTVESDDAIEDVVVIWRDREGLEEDDLRREKAWIEEDIVDAASFDSVYVNGKSFISGAEPLEITFRKKMDPAR